MKVRKPIWLVGMMGAGKSTVGRALARRLDCDFVDLDALIEERAGRSVAEIFERDGEPAFRELERECIEACAEFAGVVALGGGAICQPGAAHRLRTLGRVVYLSATPEQLLRRLGSGRGRPLLQGLSVEERLARLEALLREREAAYMSAELVVDAGSGSVREVLRAIESALIRADSDPSR